MSDDYFTISRKSLWAIVSGTSRLQNAHTVGSHLEAAADIFKKGLLFYSTPTALSKTKWQSRSDVPLLQKSFIDHLSLFLGVEEELSWHIFRCYLIHEYRGTESTLRSLLSSERNKQTLLLELWGFYRSERLYLLQLIRHVLAFACDEQHPYQSLYKGFLDTVLNHKEFASNLLKQLDESVNSVTPNRESNGPFFSDACAERWAWLTLREQMELLQIAVIFYQEPIKDPQLIIDYLKVFQSHGFGLRQPFRHLCSPNSELESCIGFLEGLLLLELMKVEKLLSSEGSGEIEEHFLFDDGACCAKLNQQLSSLGRLPSHGPILLGWRLLNLHARGEDLDYTDLGYMFHRLKVVSYLKNMLSLPIFKETSLISNIGSSLVYTLMVVALVTFQEESLGNIRDWREVAALLLCRSHINEEFWLTLSTPSLHGLHPIFMSAQQEFPQSAQFIMLARALARAGPESCKQLISSLSSLPRYTEPLDGVPRNTLTDAGGGKWKLEREREVAPRVRLCSGTHGIVTPGRITWLARVNGWQVLLSQVHELYNQICRGGESVSPELEELVIEIVKLLRDIFTCDPDTVPRFAHFTQLFIAIMEKYTQSSSTPYELLQSILELLVIVVGKSEKETWHAMSRVSFRGRHGSLHAVMAKQSALGKHSLTIAFLKLLKNAAQKREIAETDTFLSCLDLVFDNILSSYISWRYEDLTQRVEVAHCCLDIVHALLADELDEGLTEAQKSCLHKLIYTQASSTLFQLVTIANIDEALENQSNWSTGAGIDMINVVCMSLSVLNLLLLRRRRLPKEKDRCSPLDEKLQSSHAPLTMARYLFHWYLPRLPSLALRLLKRLAEEYPPTLLACLGSEAEAIRNIFLTRLDSGGEDLWLKIAQVELLTACVKTQPGLVEMLLNLKESENGAEASAGSSCLSIIVNLFVCKDKRSGPTVELHGAILEFFHALWKHRRLVAVSELKKYDSLWSEILSYLTAEHTRPSLAFYIVALELFNYGTNKDDRLAECLKQFRDGSHLLRWTKKILGHLNENSNVDVLRSWSVFLSMLARERAWVSDRKDVALEIVEAYRDCVRGKQSVPAQSVSLIANLTLVIVCHWKDVFEENGEMWMKLFWELLDSLSAVFVQGMERSYLDTVTAAILVLQASTGGYDLNDWLVSVTVLVEKSLIELSSRLESNTNLGEDACRPSLITLTLLQELLDRAPHCNFRNRPTFVSFLLSTVAHSIKFPAIAAVNETLIHLLITLTGHESGGISPAMVSGLPAQLWLPLCNLPRDMPVLTLCVELCNTILAKQKRSFVEGAMALAGVIEEHLSDVLLKASQVPAVDAARHRTVLTTVSLLRQLAHYRKQWGTQHNLTRLMSFVPGVVHCAVAHLIRPARLSELVEKTTDVEPRMRRISSASSTTVDTDTSTSPEVLQTQARLLDILWVSIQIISEFSPDIEVLLTQPALDLEQWNPVLKLGFASPALDLDQELAGITFGTIIAAINFCVRSLTKGDSMCSTSRLVMVLEKCIVLVLSQGVLYLLDSRVQSREKQLIRRDLGAELNSVNSSMAKLTRRGTPSPVLSKAIATRVSPVLSTTDQDFLKLLNHLVDRVFK